MASGGRVVAEKYQVVRLLGRGGMGEVFEAEHMATGRHVALKVLRMATSVGGTEADDTEGAQDLLRRFQREARAVGAVSSPHIVQVLDAGIDTQTGQAFMAMELLAGEDASSLLHRTGPLAPPAAAKIALQACQALASAHRAGVVHRDVKPANLFLARDASGQVTVKIVDFGIARVPKPDDAPLSLTQTGSLLGSPMYMAPEQAAGTRTIDHRADLWSLGVVLYKMVAGVTPHERPGIGIGEMLMAICSEPPPPLVARAPWAPPEIARITERALVRDPAQRYASADDMARDLAALFPSAEAATLVPAELVGIGALPAPTSRAPDTRVTPPPSQTVPAAMSGPVSPLVSYGPPQPAYGPPIVYAVAPPPRRSVLTQVALVGALVAVLVTTAIGAYVVASIRAVHAMTQTPTTPPKIQIGPQREFPVGHFHDLESVELDGQPYPLDASMSVHLDGPVGTAHLVTLYLHTGSYIKYKITLTDRMFDLQSLGAGRGTPGSTQTK